MKAINVLVTGVGGGGHGAQILKALKIAETNYKIFGTDMALVSKGLTEVHKAYLVPPASEPNYIDSIISLCNRNNIKILFHGTEPELIQMSKHRKRFRNAGIFLPINSRVVIDLCMDKVKTFRFLEEHGFNIPKFKEVISESDLDEFNVFPAVLKPSIGGGGSHNIFLAQNKEEMMNYGVLLLNLCRKLVVQEYIGKPDQEYTVGVLSDMDGNLINSIAVKRFVLSTLSNKIRIPNYSGRKDLGDILAISSGISQGEIAKFPEVTEECEKIALKIKAKGSLNIQCRLVNGKVYVFEINPRFSGTTSLRAMVGYNEPDILIRKHVLKEDIKTHFEYDSGIIMRGLKEYLIDANVKYEKAF